MTQFERDFEQAKREAYAHEESVRQRGQTPVQSHRGIKTRAYNQAKAKQVKK